VISPSETLIISDNPGLKVILMTYEEGCLKIKWIFPGPNDISNRAFYSYSGVMHFIQSVIIANLLPATDVEMIYKTI